MKFEGNFHRPDGQRIVAAAHPQVRKDRLGEAVLEGVDVRVAVRVMERHPALVTVQLHPDPLRIRLQRQPRQRGRACEVHFVVEVHAEVAVVQHRGQFLLPFDRRFGHADDPRRVVSHIHLPGVPAHAKARPAQHGGVGVEALRVVGKLPLHVAVLDAGEIIRQDEPGGGGVWIQSDGVCRKTWQPPLTSTSDAAEAVLEFGWETHRI